MATMYMYYSAFMDMAREAGIKTPCSKQSVDEGLYNGLEYPHFQLLCKTQAFRLREEKEFREAAKIISQLSEDEAQGMTIESAQKLKLLERSIHEITT